MRNIILNLANHLKSKYHKLTPFKKFIVKVIGVYIVANFILYPPKFPVSIQNGKLDSSALLDKIPLEDAVKKDCLISDITIKGNPRRESPLSEYSNKDNVLRALLTSCRIADKQIFASRKNKLIIEFYQKTDFNNENLRIVSSLNPYYKIYINNELVHDSFSKSEIAKFNEEEIAENKTPKYDPYGMNGTKINSYEVEGGEKVFATFINISRKLKGLNQTRNSNTAYKRFCNRGRNILGFNNTQLDYSHFDEFKNTIKIASPANIRFCKLNQKINGLNICQLTDNSCFKDGYWSKEDRKAECDPNKEQFYQSLSSVPILPTLLTKTTFSLGWDGALGSYRALYPFLKKSENQKQLIWLLIDFDIDNSPEEFNKKYKPELDSNCDTKEELEFINSILNNKTKTIFPDAIKSKLRCSDKKSFSHAIKGQSESLYNCGPSIGFGYCSFSNDFETIIQNNKIYSIGVAYASNDGIALSGRNKQCYSTITVAN